MRKAIRKWVGSGSRGQTTAEYAIIVALIAISSIAIILIFGDQLRELFAGETKQLAGQEDATVQDRSGDIQESTTKGGLQEF